MSMGLDLRFQLTVKTGLGPRTGKWMDPQCDPVTHGLQLVHHGLGIGELLGVKGHVPIAGSPVIIDFNLQQTIIFT